MIKRGIAVSLMIFMLFSMTACSADQNDSGSDSTAERTQVSENETAEENSDGESAADVSVDDIAAAEQAESEDEEGDISMKMTINDTEVKVSWENNESVKALAKMAENGPVTIETEPYGGFEQVGSIGQTLPSNDTNIKTKAGDIMLYTSSQMVIFYGSNSWAYTRLGKITDKSNSELRDLLSGYGCKVTITAE